MDKLQDPLPASRPPFSASGEAQAVSAIDRLPAAVEETAPVSLRYSRQTSEQDLPLTTGEDAVVTSLRRSTDDSRGREAYDDGEIVTELGPPRTLSTARSRQADGPEIPVLSGDEVDITQLREKGHSVGEPEVPTVLAGVVPLDEKSPMTANECSQGRDSQELPSPTREDLASISLRMSMDCDEELEAQTPPKSDETASRREEMHISSSGCEQRTDELGSSPRAGDQTIIAHVLDRGRSGEQPPTVLEDAVPVCEELPGIDCRCSVPICGEELRLPEKENVMTCLLKNAYNRSVEEAQVQLENDGKERVGGWEEAAKTAGVKLELRRLWIVYVDEKAMDDVEVEVPRQVKYVGISSAIPSSLADAPCPDLGVDGMLQYLNCLLRTTYTLDRPGLGYVLQSYIKRGFDFGLAYGHLRFWWFEDFTRLQETMKEREMEDKARRDSAVEDAYIIDRDLPPRRAWDLYSNRVLPWWVFRKWSSYSRKWKEMDVVDAVSHSWVDPDDRRRVATPINGCEWPVPIPSDITLDQIRAELLNVGRELIWLDVLCLRQDGVIRDNAERSHEWKLDVPTIGNIYQSQTPNSVVVYFNGLGRPFRIGDLKNERHWLNRAWTLQEFDKDGIIGGLVHESSVPFPPSDDKQDEILKDPDVMRFYQQLQVASNNRSEDFATPNDLVFSVLAAMRPRYASHIVDKVGGITHILAENRIPTYTRSNDPSAIGDAWNLLIAAMSDHHRADLFFFYPVPGKLNGKYAWYPSWDQLTTFVPLVPSFKLSGRLTYNEGQFQCRGWLIEECQVQGFTKSSPDGLCRRGKLQFIHAGAEHSFSVVAHHQEPIADGRYTLKGAGTWAGGVVAWVVGTLHRGKRFEKLSVLRTEDSVELEAIQKLKLTERLHHLARAPEENEVHRMETVAGNENPHISLSKDSQLTDEREVSPPAGDQAVIAHVHESGASAGVLGETISVDEEPQVLRCRCSQPIREEALRLPEEERENVITCLLRNKYNCSGEKAQAWLARADEWKAEGWEKAASSAGVELERRRVVIVYADTNAMNKIKVDIPRQVKYVGTSPAIPSSLADTLCNALGVRRMLQHLNDLLRTTYTLDRLGLSSVLQSYVDRGFDFGLAYGHLRRFWFENFTRLQERLRNLEEADKARRDRAIDGAYILDRELPPRRAWDLYSNRVLPWWVFRKWDSRYQEWQALSCVDAISHSWVHDDDRQSVWTPINGYQWPVPIPQDTTLDRVRVELLNVGREVVWLDVLCLWQEGVPKDDAERLHEWELDVPTIGSVYQSSDYNTVVTYFNGLGRPFCIGNLDNERHWLNRAWTFQEYERSGIIGGLVPGSFPPLMFNKQIISSDLNVIRFYHRLQAASNNNFNRSNVVLSVLAAMGPRHAAHVVDKVGGITHILAIDRIPKYIRGDEVSAAEDAWNLLMPVIDSRNRADLFFLHPGRDNRKYAWCPSWEQVNDPLQFVPPFKLWGSLEYNDEDGRFEGEGWLIARCKVQGFAKPNTCGSCRTGTLRVVHDGAEHSFTVAAHHQVPISDGSYALIGGRSYDGPDVVVWAVGTLDSDKRFEKLSVLRTEDEGDIKRLEGLKLISEWRVNSFKSWITLV